MLDPLCFCAVGGDCCGKDGCDEVNSNDPVTRADGASSYI